MTLIEQLDNTPIHFIIGAGRSGTTLLTAVLNAHPNICCTPEVKPVMTFYTPYAQQKKLSESIVTDFHYFLQLRYKAALKKKHDSGRNLFDKQWFDDLQTQLPQFSYANFAKYILLSLNPFQKNTDDIKVLIDKNPTYTFCTEELIKLYPQAKFLIAVRDYRSYYLSQKQNIDNTLFSRFLNKSAAANAYFWQLHYLEINRLQQQYPQKVMLVPYEKMVSDKENLLKEICSFLDIPMNDAMIQHNQNETAQKRLQDTQNDESLNEYEKRKKENLGKTIFTDRLEAWKNELTPAEISSCEAICGEIGTQFGYQPTQNISNLKRFWVYFSGILPLTIIYISVGVFMKNHYNLPLSVRNFLIKYLKFRH